MVRTKPSATQDNFALFVRHAFRTQAASVSTRNVSAIEHLMRRGVRQLEMYESPSVRDVYVSEEMRRWAEGEGMAGGRRERT
jgi:succinate dehydrogenase assembly factor 1